MRISNFTIPVLIDAKPTNGFVEDPETLSAKTDSISCWCLHLMGMHHSTSYSRHCLSVSKEDLPKDLDILVAVTSSKRAQSGARTWNYYHRGLIPQLCCILRLLGSAPEIKTGNNIFTILIFISVKDFSCTAMQESDVLGSHDMDQLARFEMSDFDKVGFKC